MRQKVIAEIDRLENEGIIEPVQFSVWATTCVPVIKSDKSILLCGDYSKTANTALKHEPYSIPRIKRSFLQNCQVGEQKFSKIDLSQADQQLRLTAESRARTTINTKKGLHQYTRLPHGMNQCLSIFQRILLQDCQGTCVYLDDILVTGKTDQEHFQNLERVLQKLQNSGLRANRENGMIIYIDAMCNVVVTIACSCNVGSCCTEYIAIRIAGHGNRTVACTNDTL